MKFKVINSYIYTVGGPRWLVAGVHISMAVGWLKLNH